MDRWPRITIVTPSYNQGKYIAETIESVLAQEYPNVEHIVMDGGSTDDTLAILRRYPHLKVISEPDRGQSDAINKGFRMATGKIWGYLCSDDTLLPGALHRVAQEIDPARGRHIVMGRCRFIDENSKFTGIEHPSHFASHRRMLEIWKGHLIPQPAVFWTPEVWKTRGPLDMQLKYHMDYDLFCRFSQKYRFHFFDQVIATYRLHTESKTQGWSEADRLEDSIRLSRRYWGSPLVPMYWQLNLSLAWYQFNRVGRARSLYEKAREARHHRQLMRGSLYMLAAGSLAPDVAFYIAVYPRLRRFAKGVLSRILERFADMRRQKPQTAVYMGYTNVWSDRWVGPRLVTTRQVGPGAQRVIIRGEADLRYIRQPFVLTVLIDDQVMGQQRIEQTGHFELDLRLPLPLSAGAHTVEVRSNAWWVHHYIAQSGDYRPLAWRAAPQDPIVLCSSDVAISFADHSRTTATLGCVAFTSGWHEVEANNLDWVRWTPGRGEMRVQLQDNSQVALRGELYSIQRPNTIDVLVNGQKAAMLDVSWEGFGAFGPINCCLKKGDNVIELISHNTPITTPTDSRPLAVAIRNILLEARAF